MKHQMEDYMPFPWQVERFEELEKLNRSIYFDIDDFLEIIEFYIYQGKYQKALTVSEYALKVHEGGLPILIKKAQLLATLNREDRALELLAQLELVSPSNPEIFLTKGAIHSQLRNYQEAIIEYEKALKDSEEPEYVYMNIAFEYENLGNFRKTLDYLGKAIELNPENEVAIFEMAYCFDLLSLTEESISFFKNLIDRNPYQVEAWFNLGASYLNAGQHENALEAFDYAITIDENHLNAWFYKGICLNQRNRNKESLEAFMNSLSGEEDDAIKYYHIGECYEKLEEFGQAAVHYRRATQLDNTIADAWIGTGVCEQELGNTTKAIFCFEKGLELDPENQVYMCLLADAFFSDRKFTKGIELYEKAVKINALDAESWLEYAEALWFNDFRAEAAEVATRALESLPDNVSILFRLSAFLFLSGKESLATYFLEEALVHDFEGHNQLLDSFPELSKHSRFNQIVEQYRVF
ncbi:MAG TPA: tetratricopeptide repeat protein [Bacteroidales bacterium]|nr:tetratricopeptide repeat protein [Bacteroidales bacterium]